MAITEGRWVTVAVLDAVAVPAVVAATADAISRPLPLTTDDARLMAAAPELASLLDQILELSAPLKCERDREQAQAVFARANELLGLLGF